MLRTILLMGTLLIFSSVPLAADHGHHRRSSGFSAFFSFGDGHYHQPRRYRGHRYDRGYYGNRYYRGGYYDSHRRFHKHQRKRYRKYKKRFRNHRRYRHYDYCPYH